MAAAAATLLVLAAPALGAAHTLVVVDLDSGATRSLARARVGWESLRPTLDGRSVLAMRSAGIARVRRRFDLASGRQTRLPGTREGPGSFSPDGTRVFAGTGAPEIGEMVLRTVGGRPLARLRPRVPDHAWERRGRPTAGCSRSPTSRTIGARASACGWWTRRRGAWSPRIS